MMKTPALIVMASALFLAISAGIISCNTFEHHCFYATVPNRYRTCRKCETHCNRVAKTATAIKEAYAIADRASRCGHTISFMITATCIQALKDCEETRSRKTCRKCLSTCAWTLITRERNIHNRRFRVWTNKNKREQLAITNKNP